MVSCRLQQHTLHVGLNGAQAPMHLRNCIAAANSGIPNFAQLNPGFAQIDARFARNIWDGSQIQVRHLQTEAQCHVRHGCTKSRTVQISQERGGAWHSNTSQLTVKSSWQWLWVQAVEDHRRSWEWTVEILKLEILDVAVSCHIKND